jgi:hypothetical protein
MLVIEKKSSYDIFIILMMHFICVGENNFHFHNRDFLGAERHFE